MDLQLSQIVVERESSSSAADCAWPTTAHVICITALSSAAFDTSINVRLESNRGLAKKGYIRISQSPGIMKALIRRGSLVIIPVQILDGCVRKVKNAGEASGGIRALTA